MKFTYQIPEAMFRTPSAKGEVVRFTYDTQTYDEQSEPLKKGAWVYLPYGYTAEKQYDILYLLHGGGENEDWWFKKFPDTVTMLDNMIADGICRPCIIVTPTFYRNGPTKEIVEDVTEHFKYELRRDLIPAVEKAFSTYAGGDVSEANLVSTRAHRAFAGLSLGSMTTYRAALYNNFDLFAWYGPFSGCAGPKGSREAEVKRICEALAEGEKKGLDLKCMFCCNGDKDIAYAEHIDIMEKAEAACPQLKKGENYFFMTIPGGVHDMKAWQTDLYNALSVFFRAE